jgi:hypothetical protein
MSETDVPIGIKYAIQRHAPQLEEFDFLPIPSGNQVIGVRQSNKGNPFIPPILPKG